VGTVKVEDLYELFYVSVVRLGAGYYVFIPWGYYTVIDSVCPCILHQSKLQRSLPAIICT